MDWRQKINEWYQKKLLSVSQKKAIEIYEKKQEKSFWFLGIIWTGIVTLSLGILILGRSYETVMSVWSKVGIVSILIIGSIVCAGYACYRRKHLLYESTLFFTFLMIGGGTGLIAQIFNVPVASTWGLLLWAIISFIIVILSEHEFLSLLWIPLFLGGVLGYWHLELLLLFFADDPILTVCISSSLLFGIMWLTGESKSPFIYSINRWAIVLLYMILLIGEYGIHNSLVSFLITIVFLVIMVWYSMHFHYVGLFNLSLFLIALRLIYLCLELWYLPINIGWELTIIGGGILIFTGGYLWITNQREDKR